MALNPAMRALYQDVFAYLQTLGPVTATWHKTQVSFGGEDVKTYFSFVWLPQLIKVKFPPDAIMLTIDLPRHLSAHPRIQSSVKLREGRWTHHLPITKKADITADVKSWLRESYEFGKIGLRKSRQ